MMVVHMYNVVVLKVAACETHLISNSREYPGFVYQHLRYYRANDLMMPRARPMLFGRRGPCALNWSLRETRCHEYRCLLLLERYGGGVLVELLRIIY